MRFEAIQVEDKKGRIVELRNAEIKDAENMVEFMKKVTVETPYLIREPDEFSMTSEQERRFIQERLDAPKELMLIATVDGKHIGNCSLMSVGGYRRYMHRCEVAIALYQKYCGAGIGRLMMEAVLEASEKAGYEQVELEVMEKNLAAVNLYKKLGFEVYGTFPHNMKYSDGTYGDALWMMKRL